MGSSPKTDWGKRASNIYWEIYNNGQASDDPIYCTARVKRLADEMKAKGETFEIVRGYYENGGERGRHTWIEYNGKVLDPSQINNDKKYYKTSGINYYEKGRIIPKKTINHLKEYLKINNIASLFGKPKPPIRGTAYAPLPSTDRKPG